LQLQLQLLAPGSGSNIKGCPTATVNCSDDITISQLVICPFSIRIFEILWPTASAGDCGD